MSTIKEATVHIVIEVITCDNCGSTAVFSFGVQGFDFVCDICGKEGCLDCMFRFNRGTETLYFHRNCKKEIPKDVLENWNEQTYELERYNGICKDIRCYPKE